MSAILAELDALGESAAACHLSMAIEVLQGVPLPAMEIEPFHQHGDIDPRPIG